jgi:hypothetical protein
MAINIQDNFQLNIALPIDSRIVASGSAARSAITFKYDGLRVFDTSDRKTYIWNASINNYQESDISGAGVANSISRWSTTSGLTSSGLFFLNGTSTTSGRVGINTNIPRGLLHIASDGSGVTNFVVHGNSTGVLVGQNFYNSGTDQYFDFGYGSVAMRLDTEGNFSILARPIGRTGALDTVGDTDVIFKIEGTNNTMQIKKNIVMYTPPGGGEAQGSLYIRAQQGYSTRSNPDIAWWYNDKTGFYHPAKDQIGIALGDVQVAKFTQTGLLLASDTVIPGGANYRIQIDNGTGLASWIQFTQGTTTGTGNNRGFLLGIGSGGNAILANRFNAGTSPSDFKPILLSLYLINAHHEFDRNRFTIYSETTGQANTNVSRTTAALSGTRVIRATRVYNTISSGVVTATVETLTVPSSSQVTIEATFVCSEGTPTFLTHKLLKQFTVNPSGVVTIQGAGGNNSNSGQSLATLQSTISGKIGIPQVNAAGSNTIQFVVPFLSGHTSGSSTLSYTAIINTRRGN